ncbi:DUF423 domain-containing protein [Parvularcula marina]|uniref:DUF423 domain-containing protein n=1 Tax=Parvularcula marina TaxID=2292771 RepID=A0A371RHC0_9PROT|nr:DUF423 domain-containing protein [Parvularcula marina]RFB04825.1 DUF423 domain-containing protein [Parvularcula marina]
MSKTLTFAAALLGFLAVAAGAFGAHALDGQLTEKAADWWQTGTFYLLTHAVAAFAVGVSGQKGLFVTGGWCLALGCTVFGASLYALALGAPSILGAITPIGGILMLAGWALAAIGAIRR